MGKNKTKAGMIAILGGALVTQGCPNGILKTKAERDSIKLEKRLKHLAETPFKGRLYEGAMCYLPSASFEIKYFDYICPYCNDTIRNTYTDGTFTFIEKIENIINSISALGYDVVLDKSNLCPNCTTQNFEECRELVFKIRFTKNAEYHAVATNDEEDYCCVRDFLAGRNIYWGYQDREYALHDNIDVIQKMTGLGRDLIIKEKE